jgi:hypothetical protein
MRSPTFLRTGLLAALAMVTACADYSFTVNDRVVYTPAELFKDYAIADPALRNCIDQTITDHSITAAAQLVELNCSHAGVQNLEGLQVFTGLRRLKLSSNAISDLSPLADLRELTDLELDENRVVNLGALRGLANLRHIDLSGNLELNCAELVVFDQIPDIGRELPTHCQK